MFTKILIANRGEIACRVIETARALGVRTVAVYSDADAGARHVAMADEAVYIGGPKPADSYLRAEEIIAAAQAKGAEAVHPGYGFLSENPEFVEACARGGLVFVGPSAKAIRAMGLKDAAKALMEEAGVPVVPGYHGAAQDGLAERAAEIGYPVLIKAVAGGGGKGMRRVDRAEDFADALASARGEAATAFGNDAVLIEKFVATPRHIEVQVFGDGTHAVHLFERDCSLQRRHQKVIEEAPAPGMTAEMRAAMGQAAVRAAEAIGYKGAGTVEFIVDASDGLRPDRFYFMEMNTRLQVEHPVTEAITGIDLVEWQLRVAAGEALPLRQEDLSINGHAFEARLYAEDVPKGFLPATGTLAHLKFPDGARADTGVRPGDEISPWYDPMIAKLIVHAPTREIALLKLDQALAGTEVAGSVTNLAFLRALARHNGFAAGQFDTGLIDRDVDALSVPPTPCTRCRAVAAMGAMGLTATAAEGFSLWGAAPYTVHLTHADETIAQRVTMMGPGHGRVTREDGGTHEVQIIGGTWHVDGAAVPAKVVRHEAGLSVFWGNNYHFGVPDPLDVASDVGALAGRIEAPMPGLVKAIFVEAGAKVAAGDRLAVLEAMKMEHALTAGRDGIVADVLCSAGAQVDAGATLIVLEEDT
ncbi:acetyl/propionyl/methylcrotonyl-CoA carboxylase subunit alpha [Gymnodinialimonas sp. 2305UL16-5]|uniref:acetyl/propionyl/methylcrotonyl-CoA carboxylase subunit alpha n=1 Tax=Gymnodinialimonas mytili TaxID=3126503 RepID=UPI00309C55AE